MQLVSVLHLKASSPLPSEWRVGTQGGQAPTLGKTTGNTGEKMLRTLGAPFICAKANTNGKYFQR